METLIITCLVTVIILLLQDKIIIRKPDRERASARLPKKDQVDIMGLPRHVERLVVPTNASKSHNEKPAKEDDTFELETGKESFAIEIPQEELDEVFGELPDLDEEEEEWRGYGDPNGEEGFATGVTFEELSAVGLLLQQEMPEPALQQRAVDIVHRIQGTELFNLLENSMENASQKIARLLDRRVSAKMDSGSSTMRDKGLGDFNIGEFV